VSRWRGPGPGLIVAAAFIGPGTVTTATLAGANFGLSLLWALAFATVATIILQEMSARLGLVTGSGLGTALKAVGGPSWVGVTLAGLGVGAVVSGAVAFQAGNLTGAGLGLSGVFGQTPRVWAVLGALLAATLLWTGRYQLVERTLAVCVAVMGLVFLATAIMVAPSVGELMSGIALPTVPSDPTLVIALIGTTIVPYNLFLHAATVRERWNGPEHLPAVRRDLVIAIVAGGIVSGAVVVTASAALGGAPITSATDMAQQLEPLLGRGAAWAFAAGFAAAGISSAITAPLAAAYATIDVIGRPRDVRSLPARAVWGGTIAIGAVVTLIGFRPVPLIVFAQVINGLILPLVAAVLLIAMNDRARLGPHVNTWKGNLIGAIVVLLCFGLGLRSILRAL
jgi:Mn2+/Fe2+ NRAMP family transporter